MDARTVGPVLLVGLVMCASVSVVSAHDAETVDVYEITFGGSDEPVITDERMGLELEIVETETGEPVEGLQESLTIGVQRPFGNETHELDVSSRFGAPGCYKAPIVYTEPGTDTVFVDGTVVDLSFQKQVHDASALDYPTQPTEDAGGSASLTAGLPGVAVGATVAVVGMALAFVAGRRR